MGQRTQILVVRENKSGEKKSKFYHDQWGFGRSMYLALIDCFINDYNKDTFVKGYNFLDNKNFGCFDRKLSDETPLTYDEVAMVVDHLTYPEKQEIYKDLKEYGSCFVKQLNRNIDVDKDLLKALNDVDINDFKTIQEVFKYGDNNNGGLVIYIKEDDKNTFYPADFKIGFLLGDEDSYRYEGKVRIDIEEPFSRWLTPEEYSKMNGGNSYSDENFVKIFTDFCKYFGIEYFEN